MSNTFVVYPIWTALRKAETYLDDDASEWATINDKQKQLMELYRYRNTHEKIALEDIKEIESMASRYYEDVNDFLKERGFDIRLDPFSPEEGFGVASVFHLLADWLEEGEAHNIKAAPGTKRISRSNYYPGVKMDNPNMGPRNFKVIKSEHYENPIIYLPTKSEYRAFITVADQPRAEFDLLDKLSDIVSGIDRKKPEVVNSYSSIIFPKVDLDVQEDISWLEKMFFISSVGQPWYIDQAKQQTKLQINELGLKAESAVALAMRKCAAIVKNPLIIDRPFFFWISHPKMIYPVFVAYVTEEHWKDPGHFQSRRRK